MELTILYASLVIFFGAFTQSLTGFGIGLVTMAMLPALLGLHTATPLVALAGTVLEVTMLIRYHQSLQLRSIWRLVVAATLAVPAGVYILQRVNEHIALLILGIIITGYAIYALIGFRLPELGHSYWAWLLGGLGGMLGGAFNTAGPPVIIYGNCRKWSPQEFKSNLAGFFIVNSLIVVSTHWWSGNYTLAVMTTFWWSLPALFLGFWAGQSLDRWLNPERFRKIVLLLLVGLGVRLMLST
ncbi:MAG TPA: sulfite exporter TauE/SafE family protein [Anaerolineales bacterium]|nr:sulfite exporter TauE/SafE family protein [Anaerolineales bacterium]